MIPRRYLTFLNFFLSALLLAGAGAVAWLVLSPPEISGVVSVTYQPPERKSASASAPGRDYYDIISQRNLWETKFQPPEEKPPPTPPAPLAPPPRLELKGTSIHEDPEKSWAIIEDLASKTEKIYRHGDVIRGWKVVEIDRTEVTLLQEDRRHVIKSFKEQIPVPSAFRRYFRVFRQIGPNRWQVSRQGLWNMVNRKMIAKLTEPGFRLLPEDVIGSLRTVGCRPYYPPKSRQQGPAAGYEIVVLPQDHLAHHLGIREGDIVISVNGKKITGKQQALDILLEVQGESLVKVEISRGDRMLQLEYLVQEKELEPLGS